MTIENKEFKQILLAHITGLHKNLLCEALMTITTDAEKEFLLKAISGIKPVSKYVLFLDYYVQHTSHWRINEKLSKEVGFINEYNETRCKLIAFEPWSNTPYQIEYNFMDDSGNKKQHREFVSFEYLRLIDEFPEDLVSLMHQKKEDLPF